MIVTGVLARLNCLDKFAFALLERAAAAKASA
jgi:hypothetical protein